MKTNLNKKKTTPKIDSEEDILEKTLKNLKIMGMAAAEAPTYKNLCDRVRRWFSREFSVSLLEVEKLDMFYIFRHYFEDTYNKRRVEDPVTYERELIEVFFPETVKADEDWIEELKKEAAREKESKPENKVEKKQQDEPQNQMEHNLWIPEGFEIPESGSLGE
jgi:hypothetical protein